MKKFFSLTILAIVLFFAVSVSAATLKWDASTGADGYNVYFTDGTNDFNYNAENNLEVPDIDTTLNLHRGTNYTFTVTAYNIVGESGHSNSCNYTTADGYVPPPNAIPVVQGQPTVLILTLELP